MFGSIFLLDTFPWACLFWFPCCNSLPCICSASPLNAAVCDCMLMLVSQNCEMILRNQTDGESQWLACIIPKFLIYIMIKTLLHLPLSFVLLGKAAQNKIMLRLNFITEFSPTTTSIRYSCTTPSCSHAVSCHFQLF